MSVYVTHDTGVREVFKPAAYEVQYPDAQIATCGHCGRSWDDSLSTAWTPAPSGRCPFEYEHQPERVYPVDGQYDLDIRSSGTGWTGTYASLIRTAVEDITYDGNFGPVEVTLDDGRVITGTLIVCPPDEQRFTVDGDQIGLNAILIDGRGIAIDDIVRFRA